MAILTVPDPAALTTLAETYDLGHLSSATGIEAGTVNTSYRLLLGGVRYFLRIYEEQGFVGARREAGLLVHLAGRGVPTPEPIAARDGERVRSIAGKPAALFPWIDGEIVCQKRVDASVGHAVGVALATVHMAGSPAIEDSLDAGRFGPDALVTRCDRIATSTDPAARAAGPDLRARVAQVATRRRTGLPTGLVHGDLFRDNVLWREGKIVALLDFESAHLGPFAYDLAVTILSWSFGSDLDLEVAHAIASGYGSVRRLEPVERDAFFDEAILATLRFTITRITDDAIRVGKRWQRFVARREALEALGPARVREVLGC